MSLNGNLCYRSMDSKTTETRTRSKIDFFHAMAKTGHRLSGMLLLVPENGSSPFSNA